MTLLALVLAATNVVLVTPWSHAALRPGFAVSGRVTGSCWIRSLVTDRSDAWRCMAGNDISDPCFSTSSSATTVACLAGPFSRSVVLMRTTRALPHTPDVVDSSAELRGLRLRGQPWGLRLVDGEECTFMTGATDVVAGMRLNYACTKGWGIGVPDRTKAVWQISYIVSLQNRTLRKMGVAEAAF